VGWQESKEPNPAASQTTTRESQAGSVSVEIGGKRLALKTDREDAHIERLATYVDDKLETLRRSAPSVAHDKLLMMVSMTLAEELFEARQELERLRSSVRERVDRCLTAIDEAESELV